METYYTVYKVTNNIDGKIYIGCHKTKDINDNYMGSGKYLKRAQEKYGLENFSKEIIEVFDNHKDMFALEAKLVNEDFLALENTYNLKLGGSGGFDYINSSMTKEKRADISSKGGKTRHIDKEEWSKRISDGQKSSIKFKNADRSKVGYGMLNKKHSKESKNKISKANKISQKGERNSQYGKRFKWMNNSIINRKVPLNEVENYIQDGFEYGKIKRAGSVHGDKRS